MVKLDKVLVEIGAHQLVEIDKLYGPLVACGVRIWLDVDPGQWVVEREGIDAGNARYWEEMARFSCQESIHFDGDE